MPEVENVKKMSQEEFNAFSVDMFPVIEQMNDILKKHNVECPISILTSIDGFLNLFTHSGWRLIRSTYADSPEISFVSLKNL